MSISNSNERIPDIKFGQIWFLVFICLFIVIGGWNYYWDKQGIYLRTRDNLELWSYHRGRIKENQNIVLIGTSRILSAIDQKTIYQVTKKKPVQLGIAANSPLPILENFAEDESFSGTIISDFEELAIYRQEIFNSDSKNDVPLFNAKEAVKNYKESSIFKSAEFRLSLLSEHFIAFPTLGQNPADSLNNMLFIGIPKLSILENALKGEVRLDFERSLIFSVDQMSEKTLNDLQEMQRIGFNKLISDNPPNTERFLGIITKIEGFVNKIQARGGKVIFVSLPKNGEIWEINERGYPRKEFWDVFASRTSAKTIHFKDYSTLSKFKCPDGSHLDSNDAPAFTEALIEILKKDLQE